MKLRIEHSLTYQYAAPVFLEPHRVLLRPQPDAYLHLLSIDRRIAPQPDGMCQLRDAFDNVGDLYWFNEMLAAMDIRLTCKVETLLVNPFDFFVTDPEALNLPISESAIPSCLRSVYLPTESDGTVAEFAHQVADDAGRDTLGFLSRLADQIHEQWETIIRPEGASWPAAQTLRQGEGACRDLAWLFVMACRSQGVPARFVSGYGWSPEEHIEHQLHAWAEVFLPGPGWRGYDPTLGLAVADAHVPVARAASPDDAGPVLGSYRGSGVDSTMQYAVDVQRID